MKTTISGKEIKLVTRNDISAIVSQKVAEMLAQGFILCFNSGSQGEEGKVCLTNDGGKTVYVFWIHKEYEHLSNLTSVDTIYITGKKYSDVYEGKTLWFKEGELFFEQKWFRISSKKERYVEDVEDLKLIDKVHLDRRDIYYELKKIETRVELPAGLNKVALKIIKKKKGYKSVSLKDVKCIIRRVGYGYIFCFTKESEKSELMVKFGK